MTAPTELPTCARHPDRETRLSCPRCDRPACAACLSEGVCDLCSEELRARQTTQPPAPRTPVVSVAIIALCVGVFALSAIVPTLERWFLIQGAQQQELVAAGESWRLLTATLLHAGLTHLLFNMWALYVLGVELERRVGALPFAALYLAAGVGGGALYQVIGGAAPVVGASGAIFGLFGCWLVAGWKARGSPAGRASFQRMVVLLAINLALPLLIPGIAWQAHLGGFAVGLVVASMWLMAAGRSPRVRIAIAAAVGLLAFVAGTA